MKRKNLFLAVLFLLTGTRAAASGEVPSSMTYQGKLYKANGQDPVEAAVVQLKLQVRSPDGLCLLFEETYLRDMTGSNGLFTLVVGEGTNTGASALTLNQVFDNAAPKVGAAGCQYTPLTGDTRRLRLNYDDGDGIVNFTLDQTARSVPYALSSQSLGGLNKDQFVQVSPTTTQLKVDQLTSKTTELVALASGTSSLYAKSSDMPMTGGALNLTGGGVRVPTAPLAPDHAVNKNYADERLGGYIADFNGLTEGTTMVWNAQQNKWVTTVPTLATIGSAGTYSKVTTDAFGRVVAGSALTGADLAAMLGFSPMNSAGGIFSGAINMNTNNILNTGYITMGAGKYMSLGYFDASAEALLIANTLAPGGASYAGATWFNSATKTIKFWDGTQAVTLTSNAGGAVTEINVLAPLTVVNARTTPTLSLAAGAQAGQSLNWNGTAWSAGFSNMAQLRGNASAYQFPTTCSSAQIWSYSAVTDTFSCANVAIAQTQVSGLGGAAILNVGTGAGTVAAGNDARLVNAVQTSSTAGGDVSGSWASLVVEKIRSIAVSATAPTNGQVLKYDSTLNQWRPSTDAVNGGTVTGVTAGSGLTGGTISVSGTLAVDTGTTANKIVQLDASARLPAVDGSQLTRLPGIALSRADMIEVSGTYTVPAGVYKIFVEVWGAGGGGGSGSAGTIAGGGGGGGGYGAEFLNVTPGDTFAVTIGAGGTAGNNANGGPGGTTNFGTVISATGGNGGTLLSQAPATGGASVATVHVDGGNGDTGTGLAVIAKGGMGGAGGRGGGSGGGGSSSAVVNGYPGVVPGGGGGGGGNTLVLYARGGTGAVGRVIVWR